MAESEDLQLGGSERPVVRQHQDLESLVGSTDSFLAVVQGWYSISKGDISKSKPNSIVRAQIGNYALAFKNGLDAAQSGHDAAVEGLGLIEQLKKFKDEGKRAEDTDVEGCIAELKKFALCGKESAHGALEGFRSVRRAINQALAELKSGTATQGEILESPNGGLQNEISILEENLDPVLAQSIEVLDGYASWWNEIDMEESAQATKVKGLADRFNSLFAMAVVSKWQKLRESYSEYTDKMHGLQDAYPDIFSVDKKVIANSEHSRHPLQREGSSPASKRTPSSEQRTTRPDDFRKLEDTPQKPEEKADTEPSKGSEEHSCGCCTIQ